MTACPKVPASDYVVRIIQWLGTLYDGKLYASQCSGARLEHYRYLVPRRNWDVVLAQKMTT